MILAKFQQFEHDVKRKQKKKLKTENKKGGRQDDIKITEINLHIKVYDHLN